MAIDTVLAYSVDAVNVQYDLHKFKEMYHVEMAHFPRGQEIYHTKTYLKPK